MSTVNINTDSEEMISQLPGFDLNLARKVIEARANGIFFSSIDELAIYLQLKPHIIHKLEGLVSFEYEKNNPPKTNNRRKINHKARKLDFNGTPNVITEEETTPIKNNQEYISENPIKNKPPISDDSNLHQEQPKQNTQTKISQKNYSENTISFDTNPQQEQQKQNTQTKICPKCNSENQIDNKFCIICGTNLQQQPKQNTQTKICPNCYQENELDHKFCVYCGTKFPVINSNDVKSLDSTPSNNDTNHRSRRLDF